MDTKTVTRRSTPRAREAGKRISIEGHQWQNHEVALELDFEVGRAFHI